MAKEKMTEEQAKKYLKRKGKDVTDEEVEKCVRSGKLYGDPCAFVA